MNVRGGRPLALFAAALAVAALGGCISLLPKQKPAQLYRFGVETTAPAADSAGDAARITIRAAPTSFVRAAASDRILTATGNETAYIAGARWVTAAATLFDDAVTGAFEARGGPVRLIPRDQPVVADYVLKLDVQTFEIRYDRGRGEPPRVVVQLYAGLSGKQAEGGLDRVFRAEEPAGSNSVHAIAAAFDAAVGKVLGDMVAWVDASTLAAARGGAAPGAGG
jgi:cholesterol transport system auxiliary component